MGRSEFSSCTQEESEASVREAIAHEEEFCELVFADTPRGRVGFWCQKQPKLESEERGNERKDDA